MKAQKLTGSIISMAPLGAWHVTNQTLSGMHSLLEMGTTVAFLDASVSSVPSRHDPGFIS